MTYLIICVVAFHFAFVSRLQDKKKDIKNIDRRKWEEFVEMATGSDVTHAEFDVVSSWISMKLQIREEAAKRARAKEEIAAIDDNVRKLRDSAAHPAKRRRVLTRDDSIGSWPESQ